MIQLIKNGKIDKFVLRDENEKCKRGNISGDSLLHIAVINRATAVCNQLVDFKWDINIWNETALHLAVKYGQLNVIELLIETKWIKFPGSMSIFENAVHTRNVKIAKLLIATRKLGADTFTRLLCNYEIRRMIGVFDRKEREVSAILPDSFLSL